MIAERLAEQMWLADVPVRQISRELRIPRLRLYRWQRRYGWPERHPEIMSREERIAMAAQYWAAGYPTKEIAALCDVTTEALRQWRVEFGWAKRDWARGRRLLGPFREAGERMEAEREARRARAQEALQQLHEQRKWRCCDRLVHSTDCPCCGRRWPLVA